jgi:glyoxylase-like metal-dependent hydrolase (beta-lactamase superfamily II)
LHHLIDTCSAHGRLGTNLARFQAASDQLDAAGYDRRQLRYILTHAHWDHVSGVPHSIISDLYPVGRRSTAMAIFSLRALRAAKPMLM